MRVTSREAKRLARQAHGAMEKQVRCQPQQEDKADELDAILKLHAPDLHANLVREHEFVPDRRFRADFAHVASRVLIEVDGGQWAPGGGRHNQDKDREKRNLAALNGWRVLYFSPRMIEDDPIGVVEMIVKCVADASQA